MVQSRHTRALFSCLWQRHGGGDPARERDALRAGGGGVHVEPRRGQHAVPGTTGGHGVGELLRRVRRHHPVRRLQDERHQAGEGHLHHPQLPLDQGRCHTHQGPCVAVITPVLFLTALRRFAPVLDTGECDK